MNNKIFFQFIAIIAVLSGYSQNTIWNRITETATAGQELLDRTSKPETFYLYSLDINSLRQQLEPAPQRGQGYTSNVIIPFPDGNGTMKNYRIYRADVMHAELTAKYPGIQSYAGQGVSDASATIRFSVTPLGFYNITHAVEGTSYIDPYTKNLENYIVYKREGLTTTRSFYCGVEDDGLHPQPKSMGVQPMSVASSDGLLRTYRLAMACTVEYAAFHINAAGLNDGTLEEKKEAVLAAMNITVARVNSIYERDLSITLQLIPDNEDIIFIESDEFDNANTNGILVYQSQEVIDDVIGFDNYDIGHTVSTGGGGLAQLYSPCSGGKARGITGLPSPVGDPFDVDYVSHEMGHQFGGRHSFNNSCNGNRSNPTAYEPGSGSTIMAYAGICPPNVQSNSDAHFHAYSIAEMSYFISNDGDCGENEDTGNIPPVVDAGPDYTIPNGTPFILAGTASDANGDAMTYNWEQLDNEISEQPPVPDATEGPNFRSLPSKDVPERFMPDIEDVLNNNLTPTWEVISDVAREFNFVFTVRDNNISGGQVVSDVMNVNVSGVAGPFKVTSPDDAVSWQAGTNQNVTWNVAGTTANGVDTPFVDIFLSTDGGYTYPVILASKVPNDGSEVITVPNLPGSASRIMVKGYENIFYDLSDTDFTITEPAAAMAIAITEQQNITDCAGNEVSYTIMYNAYAGFNDESVFSTTGLPEGSMVTFSPESVQDDDTVIMTITTPAATAPGLYAITVTATSGTETSMANVYLEIIDSTFGVLNLILPVNDDNAVFNQTLFDWSDDTNATGYQIEIATDEDFTTIIAEAVVTESEYTAILEEATQYYWRVRPLNEACAGNYTNTNVFMTGITECNDYTATDTPVAIPDDAVTTVTSEIVVNADAPVQNVIVAMNISHTWVGDLSVRLISPQGTSVQLVTEQCENENNINAVFDDAGIPLICGNDPVINGTIQPEEALAAFNGVSPEGIWTLEVSDGFAEDGGAINSWSLDICTTEEAPTGSSETFKASDFILYPNPNNGEFTLHYTPVSDTDITVSVYDIRGRQLLNQAYKNSGTFEKLLSLGAAEAGVYLVTIQDGKNRVTKKIIVQ